MYGPDDIYEALKDAVRALGGAKAVGMRLRPEKAFNGAERWLLDCINPNRAEKLDPEQVMTVMRWSREVGHHDLMGFLTLGAGYESPKPRALAGDLEVAQQKAVAAKRGAEQAVADLQQLIDNPRLLALMQAAHVNTEGMTA